jgi:3-hydroxyacyl-CoA dehydrogenase
MGVKAATELMLSGQQIGAKAGLAAGLVDKLDEGTDPVPRAWPMRVSCWRRARRCAVSATPASGRQGRRPGRARCAACRHGQEVARPVLAAEDHRLRAGRAGPAFDEGLKFERAQFLACIDSPQRAGLIHAFAERETAKIPEARAAQPRAFSKIAIIGGGTMGAGITVSALDAGLVVTMIERDAESIARGQANVEKVYNGLIAKGRMSEEAKAAIMARYTPSTRYDDIADVDLVIEAVFEDLEVKKAVFKELDRVCKPGAVLATNTSYLDIDAIAAVTSRPQDVIGLHFFSPANIMKLLEIVVPAKVAPMW